MFQRQSAYGAIGDGVADDTKVGLQSVLNAAGKAAPASVYFPVWKRHIVNGMIETCYQIAHALGDTKPDYQGWAVFAASVEAYWQVLIHSDSKDVNRVEFAEFDTSDGNGIWASEIAGRFPNEITQPTGLRAQLEGRHRRF